MRFCSFCLKDNWQPRLGLQNGAKILDLSAAAKIADRPHLDMKSALEFWKDTLDWVSSLDVSQVPAFKAGDVILQPLLKRASSFRDFYAFEQHVKTARSNRGLAMIEEWYEMPVFYFSNPAVIHADYADVSIPPLSQWMDYELEIGAIIGQEINDLTIENAEEAIAGYCVLNDWSARDLQKKEMRVGLGPAKGKDFATSLSSWLVTPDEFPTYRQGKGYDLKMTATVNGKLFSSGNWKDIHYSFAEMLVHASRGVKLYPGDLIGSGTVGTGCILELGADKCGGWLKSGDLVELEIEQLGKLTNRIK
jgi:fumarylacetoacetate (FAA) hydrolase